MAQPVQPPLLDHRPAGPVGMDGAGVAYPAGTAPVLGRGGRLQQPACRPGTGLGNDPITVERAHRRILIAVHDDHRDEAAADGGNGPTVAHGGEGRGHVVGGTVGQAGVDADGGEKVASRC
jgi:hypothetical protein